jgi:superfamily I DNA/RNA helicase
MVPEGPNDLLFVGDGHQRIYPRNRASMSSSGINIRGRSRKLYLNYRTTEEIRRLAVATLEACEVDDLDEGSDEVKRYKSLSHGPVPRTLAFQHLEDALASLLPIVQAGLAEARSVCVIVPTRQDAAAVQGALKAGKIATTILGPDERDNPDSRSVRISTMHRAKGLEFDEVVLLIPQDCRGLKASADDLQRLQYVAMTRAKRLATVVRY